MFECYARGCDKLHGEVIPVPTTHLNYTRPEPYGTVVQITPWNAPLFTCGWQVAPAICAGNAVILKPSELTPPQLARHRRALREGGGAARPRQHHRGGGSDRGTGGDRPSRDAARGLRRLGGGGGTHVTPCILELESKSANIVFADADIDRAISGAQAAIFGAAGPELRRGLARARPPFDPREVRRPLRPRERDDPGRHAARPDRADGADQQPGAA